MVVNFFPFSLYHGRSPSGSVTIRVNQVVKYWQEAEVYRYGNKPDVLIFQKVYITPDYKFPLHFKGIKILDIADPDWLEEALIVETCNAMDAVTCPTEHMAKFIRQFHNNVHVIPDRFDIEVLPKPKEHTQKAKTVVWFGYSHNAETLKPAMKLIEELGLTLVVISDDDPIVNRWGMRNKEEWYRFVKYNEDTIYQELQKADFAILPDGFRPQDLFKSNNKTIKANLAGLPVAKDSEGVKKYMLAEERQKWFYSEYDKIKKTYNIKLSVKEYKEIINEIEDKKS